jgi:hypothetical protein
VGETPDTAGGQQAINYAASIGASVVFPYSAETVAEGVADVMMQGAGLTTDAAQVTAAAFQDASADGIANNTGFGVTAFSGGAQAANSAYNITDISPDVINYVSPGMGGIHKVPVNGSQGTKFFRGAGLVERLVTMSTRMPNDTGSLTDGAGNSCSHNAQCAFSSSNTLNFLTSGGACSDPKVYSADGVSSMGAGADWFLTDPLGAWMNAVIDASYGYPGNPTLLPAATFIQRR